jgi:hypothetical protein
MKFTETPTEPLTVHCGKCGREWSVGWLPMDAGSVAAVLKAAKCSCGALRKHLAMGPKPKPTAEGDPLAWITNGDTGTSSETIWGVMMGRPVRREDIPYDPADFGRCYRLLKVMPSWRARLSEVADKYSQWKPLIDAWDELTALYEKELPSGLCPKLYARMRQLRGER